MFIYSLLFFATVLVPQVSCQLATCNRYFVADTNPGYWYSIYPLELNGVPYSMAPTNLSYWISKLGFYGIPLYSGNTKQFSINNFATVSDDEVQYGDVYGHNITSTNFSATISAWYIPPKTGWYKLKLMSYSAAELVITNYTTAYCCNNTSHYGLWEQFTLTSIPSMPEVENPSGQVYLYQNFKYQMLISFINLNSTAYLYLQVVDPDGAYITTDWGAQQMNTENGTELVTCNYTVGYSTTTLPWTGLSTIEETQKYYKIMSGGYVTFQIWDVFGTPYGPSSSIASLTSQDESSSFLESSLSENTTSSSSSIDVSSSIGDSQSLFSSVTTVSSSFNFESSSANSNTVILETSSSESAMISSNLVNNTSLSMQSLLENTTFSQVHISIPQESTLGNIFSNASPRLIDSSGVELSSTSSSYSSPLISKSTEDSGPTSVSLTNIDHNLTSTSGSYSSTTSTSEIVSNGDVAYHNSTLISFMSSAVLTVSSASEDEGPSARNIPVSHANSSELIEQSTTTYAVSIISSSKAMNDIMLSHIVSESEWVPISPDTITTFSAPYLIATIQPLGSNEQINGIPSTGVISNRQPGRISMEGIFLEPNIMLETNTIGNTVETCSTCAEEQYSEVSSKIVPTSGIPVELQHTDTGAASTVAVEPNGVLEPGIFSQTTNGGSVLAVVPGMLVAWLGAFFIA